MAKIKICGLRRLQDADYVNAVLPDYVGFILTPGFRRSIDFETAEALKNRLNPKIKVAGVFVNDELSVINRFVNLKIIDAVQLHGSESPQFCNKINAPVIKAFKPDEFKSVKNYNTQYFLFDSGTGSGVKFDWSMLPETKTPFFLAGGIDADNVRQAIKQVNPYCIDVSSSVETNGFKDFDKIKTITERVRNE